MKIKTLAKYYQNTGEWTDEMEAVQNKYIVDNIGELFRTFIESIEEYDMPFDQYIGLRKGLWQAENGFCREMKRVLDKDK